MINTNTEKLYNLTIKCCIYDINNINNIKDKLTNFSKTIPRIVGYNSIHSTIFEISCTEEDLSFLRLKMKIINIEEFNDYNN